MCDDNYSQIAEFVLIGFGEPQALKAALFTFFLLIYIMILGGNLLIISLVSTCSRLNGPMFYFLKHLALTDVLITADIVPLMLTVILRGEIIVPLPVCLAQLYFFSVSCLVQCFLLAVMSYDRYLAIYNPLNYTLLMTPNVCLQLVILPWLLFFVLLLSEMALTLQLQFCGRKYIDHFYCDFDPLVKLSTSDSSSLRFLDASINIPLAFFTFGYIIITYILIFVSIIKITSLSGRKKFFSTCSSHLTTVCLYYVTLVIVYIIPSEEESTNMNKFRSLAFIVVTPLMNPIIYSLRNHEIRRALRDALYLGF